MAHNYILRVKAGPSYSPETHTLLPINTPTPTTITSALGTTTLNVRIQNYRGLPLNSPSTSPYFTTPPHDYNKDQYSIAFSFRLNRDISADDLVFGNDFDHPIRDRLPPGFGTAMKIVKWGIDPGLDGDVYADKPYLYGPFGSSINLLWSGPKSDSSSSSSTNANYGIHIKEGDDSDWRAAQGGIPASAAARRKWFLNEGNRKGCVFEKGREYVGDFFNAYLDFNEFALRLPGFTLPIMKYWDGQGLRPKNARRSHTLRYVLKDRRTGEVVFVVEFTLHLKEDVDAEGNVKGEGKEEKVEKKREEKVADKVEAGSDAGDDID